jgi:hypothetical protein
MLCSAGLVVAALLIEGLGSKAMMWGGFAAAEQYQRDSYWCMAVAGLLLVASLPFMACTCSLVRAGYQ